MGKINKLGFHKNVWKLKKKHEKRQNVWNLKKSSQNVWNLNLLYLFRTKSNCMVSEYILE
jgi:hypothetical protein